ncbi:Transcriptional regulator, MerR family [Liberibacter crescens BT-1]|uniref:Transcriptional regulator, MerR family n=1 Tax=Liberibacter crescens (strain BT-1) TaxID=1215343 RepID=L0EVM8_LIBCB|nr:MerR family transcriptional regulator [Liberibacter crescens]AGA64723.1 Transcriptional regulator, MerR family [Liberibacter crescens BT-1]AMC12810.1 MerR family transcriptional regulator [Liberibacter crescens]
MNQQEDVFRSMSEAADDLELPQHVLHFWETKFSQIKRVKKSDGHHYYRLEDMDFLKGIKILLYNHGYSIKAVQNILKTKGVQFVIAIGQGLSDLESLSFDESKKIEVEPRVAEMDDNQIVGRAKAPILRRLFKFKENNDKASEEIFHDHHYLSDENRRLLQEAIYDLLECKRLLDQVR